MAEKHESELDDIDSEATQAAALPGEKRHRELVAWLSASARQSQDPVLRALLDVLATARRELASRRELVDVQRRAYERAARAASESRRRVEAILDAALNIARASEEPPAATQPPDDAGGDDRSAHASTTSNDLEASLLGPTRVVYRGVLVEHPGAKPQTLLVYLIAHRRRPVARDVLVDLLWPDADVAAGRRNLHQLVYALRRLLRSTRRDDLNVVVHEHDHYRLNPAMRTWVDVEEFDRLIAEGRAHEAADATADAVDVYLLAESLYRGDFLEDLPYEDWPSAERARLRSAYVELADRLGELLLHAGQLDEAIAVSQRLLSRDAAYEAAHRRIIRAYLRRGERALAVRQYRTCAEVLDREFGLVPSAETTELIDLATGEAGPESVESRRPPS